MWTGICGEQSGRCGAVYIMSFAGWKLKLCVCLSVTWALDLQCVASCPSSTGDLYRGLLAVEGTLRLMSHNPFLLWSSSPVLTFWSGICGVEVLPLELSIYILLIVHICGCTHARAPYAGVGTIHRNMFSFQHVSFWGPNLGFQV